MANSTNPARGMRDFLPSDVRKREYVIGIIKEVYESYGFEPLETPSVENIETLMGKYGEEGNQLIFKILKRGEKLADDLRMLDSFGQIPQTAPGSSNIASLLNNISDLALRYDLTVPLARVVAHHKNDLPKFFKRYQIQPVWRADRPARGRYREFYQCDVDAIGSNSMVVEAEIISAACEILRKLGFADYLVRVNHRSLLEFILSESGSIAERRDEVTTILDKLDKIGVVGVRNELTRFGFSDASLVKLFDLIEKYSSSATDFQRRFRKASVDGLVNSETSRIVATKELTELLSLVPDQLETNVRIDASLARGLSYYTGTIIEIVLTNGDFSGSIGGGGRYDGLIGMFGKEQIPACGLSLGLERILVVMEERGMFPPEIASSASADVMVTIWNEDSVAESLKLASELRASGLRVLVYPEADKLGKQFKYAGQINVPYVCVIGESELAEGRVTVKNMKSGAQQAVSREQVFEIIKTEDWTNFR